MYYFKIRADICDACIFYLLSTKEFLTSCIWTLLPFNMDLQRVQNNGDDKCVYACFSPAVAVFNQNISYPDGKCYFIEVCVRSCDGCVRYFFHVLTMCPCWREITVFMQLSILGRGKSGRALNKFSAPAVRGNHEQGGEEEGWMGSWAGVGTELGSAARALCLYFPLTFKLSEIRSICSSEASDWLLSIPESLGLCGIWRGQRLLQGRAAAHLHPAWLGWAGGQTGRGLFEWLTCWTEQV